MDSLAYGEEKVGLAETGISVDEKGIVDLAGILADGDGGGMGEVVRVADDEAVKGVAGHVRQAVLGLLFGSYSPISSPASIRRSKSQEKGR